MEESPLHHHVHGVDGRRRRRWRIVSTNSTRVAVYPSTTENVSPKLKSPVTMWKSVRLNSEFPHTFSIAHRLLDLVDDSSQAGTYTNYSYGHVRDVTDVERFLEDLAFHRLNLAWGVDIRGRSSADTAFALAMAGVTRPELYDLLTMISHQELKRIGPRTKRLQQLGLEKETTQLRPTVQQPTSLHFPPTYCAPNRKTPIIWK
jgi:hypothetical protein